MSDQQEQAPEERKVACEKCKNDKFYGFVRGDKIHMRCTECGKTLLEAELLVR